MFSRQQAVLIFEVRFSNQYLEKTMYKKFTNILDVERVFSHLNSEK